MNDLLKSLHRSRQERIVASSRSFVFGEKSFDIDEKVGHSIGSKIWDGSVDLCNFLCTLDRQREFDAGARVVELGAGVGLVSIVFRTLFTSLGECVVTDRAEQAELINVNLAKNKLDSDSTRIRFQPLDWSLECDAVAAVATTADSNDDGRGNKFAYVLMSDVVSSDRRLLEPLVRTLCRLTRPGSKVYFAQHSPSEDASVLQIALLPRETDVQSTPLQEFIRMLELNFVVRNIVPNRIWIFERRTGAWFTSDLTQFAAAAATTTAAATSNDNERGK
jgi:predicted nicotinamide N-methyase